MMAAIWASVAVGAVTRVKEPLVAWKRWKGGGGVVGRGGYWAVVMVMMVLVVRTGVELQPRRKIVAVMAEANVTLRREITFERKLRLYWLIGMIA